MPSYSSYMRQMSVLDKDDDIVSWITVKGNHIPIRKGQSKEDVVKSFIEAKSKGDGGKHYITTKKHGDTRYVNPKTYDIVKTKEGIKPFGSKVEAQSFAHKLNHTDPYAGTPFAVKNYVRKQFPYEVESEEQVELTDLQGKKYTTTKKELEEAGTSKFGLDPKGIKPAILEPKKGENKTKESNGGSSKGEFNLKKTYNDLWNKHKIESGSALYEDDTKAMKVFNALKSELEKYGINELSDDVYEDLEDNNYHSLNMMLSLSGKFGKEKQKNALASIERWEKNGYKGASFSTSVAKKMAQGESK